MISDVPPTRRKRSEVRAGAGLAEELTPDLIADDERAKPTPLLLESSVVVQGSRPVPVPDGVELDASRRASGAQRGIDSLLEAWAAEPPEPRLELRPCQSGVELSAEELALAALARWVLGQEPSHDPVDESARIAFAG
jgi:hypothetical protein